MKRLMEALLIVLLSGCGSWKMPTHMQGNLPNAGSIVPDSTIRLTPNVSMSLEHMISWGVYAGVAYLVIDPLAPNWEIEEAQFPEDRYYMSLHMKRVYAGGAGEARVVFNRRARDLVKSGDYSSYEIIEYSEGMESSVLGSQRVAQGVIQLTRRD